MCKRQEMLAHCRQVLSLFEQSRWWDHLFALVRRAEPQRVLMSKVLSLTSAFEERKGQMSLIETGHREYPVHVMHTWKDSQQVMQQSLF